MKVRKLKELLEDILQTLENYEDEQEIKEVTNTYFLGNAKYFLGISGYDGGYINLSQLDENIMDEDEEEE